MALSIAFWRDSPSETMSRETWTRTYPYKKHWGSVRGEGDADSETANGFMTDSRMTAVAALLLPEVVVALRSRIGNDLSSEAMGGSLS